ncbi:hypothetical protein CC78DRAFT_562760 [Lojkania enalia]|uniref:5-Methylcytosine G/T mismatch-specific DNA glycosylase n=1 Tax=Lojkania enalia TaxID=147567 RepID=A0A9P4K1U7_9PLEO|nr:hypothetical protein CC78DRAFT_562760 [Didymosphaeria enalia]
MLSSSETRRRRKDSDRERNGKDKDKDKDRDERKERHKSGSGSKSSRSARKASSSASKDDDRDHHRRRPSKERIRTPSSTNTPALNRMTVVPEMERRSSLSMPNGSRTSLPYPSYSKSHSKENIYARDDAPERKKSPFTPEPTDVGEGSQVKDKDKEAPASAAAPPTAPARAPPSPPLTATTGADLRKTASANSMRRKNADAVHKEMEGGRRSVDSGTRLTPEPRHTASRSSIREGTRAMVETDLTSTTDSQPSTIKQEPPNPTIVTPKVRSATPTSTQPPRKEIKKEIIGSRNRSRSSPRQASDITQSTDSDATSVPPDYHNGHKQHAESPANSESSPASAVDSSPRTPTQHSVLPSVLSIPKERPPTVEYFTNDGGSRAQSVDPEYADSPLTPPPPPPPPAVMEAPRVDYLLHNGGLARQVPRSLLAVSPPMNGPQAHDVRAFFAPLQRILDDYGMVMDKNGSLAVATGYRSIARRLLDRLEAVFARNISSEFCYCIMCLERPDSVRDDDEANGVNWGEILELVSGRCDLPPWPPLEQNTGLGIVDLPAPCQNIDVDVPEQYRAHYEQQTQKTKNVVQSWLSEQQDTAPDEADDETLSFAMLTRLEPEKRQIFNALIHGLTHVPALRSQQPRNGTAPVISRAALALQRLYRLYSPPRDQLVAMYLIRNPQMHSILATLAAVTKHEWDILVSGRFDGFLWSGAEGRATIHSPPPGPHPYDSTPSNTTTSDIPRRFTPFTPGPGSRPGSTRPGSTRPSGPVPVQLDEETEIAVLAEIEREIYLGMEAMEDAFEHLHNSAEVIRRRLRERGAALSMVAQARRGSALGGIEVRTGTPATGYEYVESDNLDDLKSEILPDDSASNVSHNRRRRGYRSRARHTPAPVDEEDEAVETIAERIRRRL